MTVATTPRSTTRKFARFAGHYVEMVVAMIVGMIVLAPLWPDAATASTEVAAIVMATNMTIGMGLWMLLRRHSPARTAEMCAVMYLPFLALLVPYRLGAITADTLMVAGHVIMFPLMLVAMAWRRADYWH